MSSSAGKSRLSPSNIHRVSPLESPSKPPPQQQLRLQIPEPLQHASSSHHHNHDVVVLSAASASDEEVSSMNAAVTPLDTVDGWICHRERTPSIQSDSNSFSCYEEHYSEQSNRPSTASKVIKRLHIERQGEGGIAISGIFVWSNCYIIMLVMGAFFLIFGIVLTVIAFASKPVSAAAAASGDTQGTVDSQSQHPWAQKARIIGPVFIIIGLAMAFFGLLLWLISWKVAKDEREQNYLHRKTMSARRKFSQIRHRLSLDQNEHGGFAPSISGVIVPSTFLGAPSVFINPSSSSSPTSPHGRPPVFSTLDVAPLLAGTTTQARGGHGGGGNEARKRRRSSLTLSGDVRRGVGGDRRRGSTWQAGVMKEARTELGVRARALDFREPEGETAMTTRLGMPHIHITESSPAATSPKRVKFQLSSESN